MKYSISFSKRLFSLLTCRGEKETKHQMQFGWCPPGGGRGEKKNKHFRQLSFFRPQWVSFLKLHTTMGVKRASTQEQPVGETRSQCQNESQNWVKSKANYDARARQVWLSSHLSSPLWSCQKQREWCRDLPWPDTRPPAAPAPELWSCGGPGRAICRMSLDAYRVRLQTTDSQRNNWPGILAVQTEGYLVDTARVSHHLVKPRLTKTEVEIQNMTMCGAVGLALYHVNKQTVESNFHCTSGYSISYKCLCKMCRVSIF